MKKTSSLMAACRGVWNRWSKLAAVVVGSLALAAAARSVATPRTPSQPAAKVAAAAMLDLGSAVEGLAHAVDAEQANSAVRSIDTLLRGLYQSNVQVHVPTLLGYAESELFGGLQEGLRLHALALVEKQPGGADALRSLLADPGTAPDVRYAVIDAMCVDPNQADLLMIESLSLGGAAPSIIFDQKEASFLQAVRQYRETLQLRVAVDDAVGDYERASLIVESYAARLEMTGFGSEVQADPFAVGGSLRWARGRLAECNPSAVGTALASSSFGSLGLDPAEPWSARRRYFLQRQIAYCLLTASARAAWESQAPCPPLGNG